MQSNASERDWYPRTEKTKVISWVCRSITISSRDSAEEGSNSINFFSSARARPSLSSLGGGLTPRPEMCDDSHFFLLYREEVANSLQLTIPTESLNSLRGVAPTLVLLPTQEFWFRIFSHFLLSGLSITWSERFPRLLTCVKLARVRDVRAVFSQLQFFFGGI